MYEQQASNSANSARPGYWWRASDQDGTGAADAATADGAPVDADPVDVEGRSTPPAVAVTPPSNMCLIGLKYECARASDAVALSLWSYLRRQLRRSNAWNADQGQEGHEEKESQLLATRGSEILRRDCAHSFTCCEARCWLSALTNLLHGTCGRIPHSCARRGSRSTPYLKQ